MAENPLLTDCACRLRELEEVVQPGLEGMLKDESRLIGLMDGIDMPEIRRRLHQAADTVKQLSGAAPSDRMVILNRIIQRIVIHKQSIKVKVRNGGMWSADHIPTTDEPTSSIDIPVQLKRCGMAVRMVVPASGQALNRKPDATLVALIAKAHKWFAKLTSGQFSGIKAIAREENVGSSYVTRIVNLAFLDPGIIRKILQGAHPPELNADRLIRMVPLPESWEEQRKLLGMNS